MKYSYTVLASPVEIGFYSEPISYTKFGNFRLNINTFMICDGDEASCSLLADYLTIKVRSTKTVEKSLDLKYYQNSEGWKKTSIDLFIEPYDSTVIVSNCKYIILINH